MQRDLVLVLEDQAESRAWMAALCETAFPGVQVAQFGDLAQACAWLRAADQASLQRLRLALVDLGDRRGRIVAEDREVVAQRGVAVIVAQAQAHQADELRALDGLPRIIGQDFRKDVAELFAQVHAVKKIGGGRSMQEAWRPGQGGKRAPAHFRR